MRDIQGDIDPSAQRTVSFERIELDSVVAHLAAQRAAEPTVEALLHFGSEGRQESLTTKSAKSAMSDGREQAQLPLAETGAKDSDDSTPVEEAELVLKIAIDMLRPEPRRTAHDMSTASRYKGLRQSPEALINEITNSKIEQLHNFLSGVHPTFFATYVVEDNHHQEQLHDFLEKAGLPAYDPWDDPSFTEEQLVLGIGQAEVWRKGLPDSTGNPHTVQFYGQRY